MFVIYLDSRTKYTWEPNAYGYWRGKNYTVCGELFPVTDGEISNKTKRYSTKKRAENALESCLSRGYAYVTGGSVERDG